MRIVLLGAPGSGKGTQSEAIVKKYHVPHVATGDLLRAEVAAGTPLGNQAREIMEAGGLVPDELIIGMIAYRVARDDMGKGFLMDGFPRTLPQAKALDTLLASLHQALNVVLFFDVDYDEIIKRLLARKRSDDTEETIRNRLKVYEEQTAPVIDYYRDQGKLRTIKGVGLIQEISDNIFKVLDELT